MNRLNERMIRKSQKIQKLKIQKVALWIGLIAGNVLVE